MSGSHNRPTDVISSKLASWSDDLSVDIVSLDQEHQDIIVMFRTLEADLAAEKPLAEINESLKAILPVIEQHFHHEEVILKNIDVPVDISSDHIGEHRALTRAIEKFIHHVDETSHQDDTELHRIEVSYIHSQMMRHIKESDRQISVTLNRGA